MNLLLLLVLVFTVVSTLPGITEVVENIEFGVLPSVTINLMGLVRTLLAGLIVGNVIMLMRKQWPLVRRTELFFLMFWTLAFGSLAWSPGWALGESLRLIVHLGLAFGIYVLTLETASNKRRSTNLLKGIFIIAIILAAGSLLAFNLLPEMTEAGITELDRGERLIGLTASPNILAGNLAIFIGLSTAFILTPGIPRTWRLSAIVIAILSFTALLFTLSRSGWIGAVLAVGLALVFHRRWLWIFSIGLVMVVLLLGTGLGDRFLGDFQEVLSGADWSTVRGYQNAYGRVVYFWLPGISELTTPIGIIIGRGAGVAQAWAFSNTGTGMHSEFLQNWLDFGLVGVGLLIFGFSVIMRRAYRLYRTATNPIGVALGLGSMCVFAAIFPKFLWDHVLNGPNSWLLLMVLGLAMGAGRWADIRQPGSRQLPVVEKMPN